LPGVGDDARTFLDDSTDAADRAAAEARLRRLFRTVVTQTADAEEIYVLDLDGTVRLSTLDVHEGASQAEEAFFTTGSSHTTVQNSYRSTLTNLPTITVATPLFDNSGGGRRVAVLARTSASSASTGSSSSGRASGRPAGRTSSTPMAG
jgi:hypothetical protein